MRSTQAVSTNGKRAASSGPSGGGIELEALRTTCRRQTVVIDTLREAVSNVHRGAKALKAENAELRADCDRMRVQQRDHARVSAGVEMGEPVEVLLAADVQAPGAARSIVVRHLGGVLAPSVLDSAQLLMSELVTNSVRHSGAAAGEPLRIRVCLGRSACRLEVEDCGRDGVIAPGPMDGVNGGGMGLNLVQMLSERWGLERVLTGGTRVWAQLTFVPVTAPAPPAVSGVGAARSSGNGKPSNGRATAMAGGRPVKGSV
jgi:anti-sigma regulatory factor (Ser/Thr protein kinase)